jgi:hypothetical protein
MQQFFKSTDANAPSFSGTVGSLVALLNKCLVDGFTTASVTSIVESGTNYTVTLAVANTSLMVNDWITIGGGSPAGINIAMRINTVTSSTAIIVTGPGGLGAITGTLTYQKSSLGWSRPFAAGTNSQSYRAPNSAGGRCYLQVIDNGATAGGAKEAQVYAAEVLTADSTPNNGGGAGSGQFPTVAQSASGLACRKSATSDATVRAWTLFGDDKLFYFLPQTGDSTDRGTGFAFGAFPSVKAGDAWNTFIGGFVSFNSLQAMGGHTASQALNTTPTSVGGMYIARGSSQIGGSVSGAISIGMAASVAPGGSTYGVLAFPNGPDNGLYVYPQPVILDALGSLRGRMPAWYGPMHNQPLSLWDRVTGVSGFTGVTFTAVGVYTNNTFGQIFVDTYGPWT